ncbi:unnamed protein product [Tenebrio molitor]|nr:unnamed protein product [Tenebrio molitor]
MEFTRDIKCIVLASLVSARLNFFLPILSSILVI